MLAQRLVSVHARNDSHLRSSRRGRPLASVVQKCGPTASVPASFRPVGFLFANNFTRAENGGTGFHMDWTRASDHDRTSRMTARSLAGGEELSRRASSHSHSRCPAVFCPRPVSGPTIHDCKSRAWTPPIEPGSQMRTADCQTGAKWRGSSKLWIARAEFRPRQLRSLVKGLGAVMHRSSPWTA